MTFENQCALKGSNIFIKCRYDYPFAHIVTRVWWSKAVHTSQGWTVVPLDSHQLPSTPDYTYLGNKGGNCDLLINNLRDSDEGFYGFSFRTTFGSWVDEGFIRVSVKGDNKITQNYLF